MERAAVGAAAVGTAMGLLGVLRGLGMLVVSVSVGVGGGD